MTCDEIHLLLESDSRDATEEDALKDHLTACPACGVYAAEMHKQDSLLKRAMATKPDEAQFDRIKLRLAQRIDQDRISRPRWRVFALAGSVAAMLALGVGVYWSNTTTPEIAPVAQQQSLGTPSDVFNQVAALQSTILSSQVLDELTQLQVAMDGPENQDGKSAAEDAELYIERILSLHGTNEQAYRETLLGVDRSGVSSRLRKLRDNMATDAPKPVLASLDLAITTFDHAAKIVQSKEVASAE